MDVFRQRLEDEYDANVIITAPTVPYKGRSGRTPMFPLYDLTCTSAVVYRDRTAIISNPTDFPDVTDVTAQVKEIQEPIVNATIIAPQGGPDRWISSHVFPNLHYAFCRVSR